jgi:myosin heavy subunit
MIITGESGAGKTENAKKAIQYFARIATRVTSKEKENLVSSLITYSDGF